MNEMLKLVVPVNERDHALGPVDASVTVVNYGDYQCPDCHRRHKEIQEMVDELTDSVRFVYRHFPLIRTHPRALKAAEAAEAAAAQGKFWEMHRLLYLAPDKLDDKHLRRHAHRIGLDLERFDREMASNTYSDRIMKDYYNSLVSGISGTPTTFINGKLYPMSGVDLLATVKTMLER
jgi:protein-disulfide isomerase